MTVFVAQVWRRAQPVCCPDLLGLRAFYPILSVAPHFWAMWGGPTSVCCCGLYVFFSSAISGAVIQNCYNPGSPVCCDIRQSVRDLKLFEKNGETSELDVDMPPDMRILRPHRDAGTARAEVKLQGVNFQRSINTIVEGLGSGQTHQTVNLTPSASQVRILPPPPLTFLDTSSFAGFCPGRLVVFERSRWLVRV